MQLEVGAIVEGKVTSITKFGAFVLLPNGRTGMVHISEIAPVFVKEIRDYLTEQQQVKVKVIGVDAQGRISLSIKKAMDNPQRGQRPSGPPPATDWQARRQDNLSFEDMMSKFKQDSDEKMSDLKKTVEAKRGGFSRKGGGGQRQQ